MSFGSKVAVVTGGASGIGKGLAEELARRGAKVVVADIDEVAAKRVADAIGGSAFHVDVSDAERVQALVDDTVERHGAIDYYFNNAGIAVAGEVRDTPLESWERVSAINIGGVVHGIKSVYPVMIAQGRGHIVNTASIAGLLPCPGLVAYSMTKHAVVGITRGLRAEAAQHGVKVSALCPGFIKTSIMDHAEVHNWEREDAEKGIPWNSVETCVEEALQGVERNRELIVITRHGRSLARLHRLAPRLLSRVVTWRMSLQAATRRSEPTGTSGRRSPHG